MTSPNIFTLSEFTQLVSTALEIDSNLDTKLAIPIQIQTINAKPPSSLPPTAKSPRVLRKIKSLLVGRSPTTFPSAASESTPSSIPTLSLEINSDPSLFVPYLSLTDRHERFGGPHASSKSASIFSRGPGSCKLPTPPTSPNMQPKATVQVHRRVSSTSSISFALSTTRSLVSASTSSTSHGEGDSTTESSLNDLDPFAKGLVQVVARRKSVGSFIFPVPVPVPASPARVVRRKRTSSLAAATGGPKPERHDLPPPRYNPPTGPLPPLPSNRQSSIASNSSCSSLSPSASRSTSSLPLRSKQKALPPRRNPPMGPLPALPVPSPCSDGGGDRGLPSPPVTPPGSFRDSSSLPNKPDRNSPSSSSSWRNGSEQDWTPEMPYTSEEEKELGLHLKKNKSLSRSNEVSRKKSGRPIQVQDTIPHRLIEPPTKIYSSSPSAVFLLKQRRDLKPMGHRRTGSPFPLTLMLGLDAAPSRSVPNLGLSTYNDDGKGVFNDEDDRIQSTSAPATVPAFFTSASPFPSLSPDSASEDSDSDPLMNVVRQREMMMREPAGMPGLGKNGLPRPVLVQKERESRDESQCACAYPVDEVDAMEEELDTETPIQSPRTPTSGQFALAQMRTPLPSSSLTSSSSRPSVPLQSHRRERPRQRVPESVVVSYLPSSPSFPSPNVMELPLDPFAALDPSNDRDSSLVSRSLSSRPGTGESTSSTGNESTSSYWSAKSTLGGSFGSFSDEVGR